MSFNYTTGDSPEGIQDTDAEIDVDPTTYISEDQSMEWFNATFGSIDAKNAATEFNLAPYWYASHGAGGAEGSQTQAQAQGGPQNGMNMSGGLGTFMQHPHQPSAPSMFTQHQQPRGPNPNGNGSEAMDFMWSHPQNQNQSSMGGPQRPKGGEDSSFMDAWRMQATIEESMPDIQMPNAPNSTNTNAPPNAFAYPNLF